MTYVERWPAKRGVDCTSHHRLPGREVECSEGLFTEATFIMAWASRDKPLFFFFSTIKYKDIFECPGKHREDMGT